MMAIIFLGEKITMPIILATLMIIAGITLLSWRSGSLKLVGSAVFLWYPVAASALAGASQVVRKFGLAAVPHPFLAAAASATSSLAVSLITLWYVRRVKKPEDQSPLLLVVSCRGRYDQPRHGVYLLRTRSRQSLRGYSHQQHRTVLLVDSGGDLFT